MAISFDDAIAFHIKWKVRLSRFIEGTSMEQIESTTIRKDNLCDLGKWIYGEGAKYKAFPAYQDLVKKHADFHLHAGEVVKLVESNDRAGAKRAISGSFTAASKETVKAIMDLRQAVTQSSRRF
ncbi:MAG: CZB domain-containing protein [Gallionellaceae bacterium]|nr:CZB domain-containing protein [Gallionellaceae bacterium]